MKENNSGFFSLLNSISSEIAYKILNLYQEDIKGLNLTETSRRISEKTSTVKDHLGKLKNSKLILKKNKNYYLSNFGSYILKNLKDLEIFNKASLIFGQIPAELIPSKYMRKLIPHLKEVKIQSDQWQFMTMTNRTLNQIKNDLGKGNVELKVLGWRSLVLSTGIIQEHFKTVKLEKNSVKNFLESVNFKLISDKELLDDLENEQIKSLLDDVSVKNRIRICEDIDKFQFTLFRYNQIVQFFLNEKDQVGIGHYFLIENNVHVVEFFNDVFDYYWQKSKPLTEFLKD